MEFIEEVKIHKNKETQRFRCRVLHRQTGDIILSYTSQSAGLIGDMQIEPGATTIAHYWEDRGYVLWRMFDRTGALIGTLFHICKDVSITASQVSYCDLIVDIWIDAEGVPRVFDEDELIEAAASGLISPAEKEWIDRQKNLILEQYPRIIEGVDAAAAYGDKW